MIGLYVHLPFCLRKCPYCAFYSVTGCAEKFEMYINRVILEANQYPLQSVDTIYFGGGTPTVLPVNFLEKLLHALLERFPCKGEITIEANPATISFESLSRLKKAGFNRISIGVQSLNDLELKFLGRLHTAREAIQTIEEAARCGFSNISADVMFGLPNQSEKDVSGTIQKLMQLPVSHISAYSLSIEENTPFSEMSLILPEDETERKIYYTLRNDLERGGFMQYEISNFALPGMEAVHNTNYWLCGEYIGLGAGAHGYLGGVRYENLQDLDAYLSSDDPVTSRTILTDRDRYEERYMLGLRMREGIADDGNPRCLPLIKSGFLEKKGDKIRLTYKGMDVANYVISELLI